MQRHVAVGLVLVVLTSCGGVAGRDSPGGAELVRVEVASEQVRCVGVDEMDCLLVRRAPHTDWELFYDDIEGFVFEPGYEYELEVRVTRVDDPPADGSSLRYELIEVVQRRPGGGS